MNGPLPLQWPALSPWLRSLAGKPALAPPGPDAPSVADACETSDREAGPPPSMERPTVGKAGTGSEDEHTGEGGASLDVFA